MFNIRAVKPAASKTVASLAAVCLSICLTTLLGTTTAADDVQPAISKVERPAPITVVEDKSSEYGIRIGSDISVYDNSETDMYGGEYKNGYYLLLPSTADLENVIVRYDGDLQLYDSSDGSLYENGETVTLDFTNEKNYIYEYDKDKNLYLSYPIIVMKGGNIASVYITLDNGDAGLRHINSSHSATEPGSMLMTDSQGRTIYNGRLERMKGHGFTSYMATGDLNTKNSYNINLGSKAELIENAGKSKKWCMLRIRTWDNYDPTGVSYPMGFYLFNSLVENKYFTMTSRYIDLYVNGEYRGIYILTERMDMKGSIDITNLEAKTESYGDDFKTVTKGSDKTDPAIAAGITNYTYCGTAKTAEDVDITGGYVLEVMCGTYGEYGFRTKNGMYLNIKSPSYPTREQVCYIAEYVQKFENALFSETGYNKDGKHYSEYMDVESFTAQMLSYCFCLNWEVYRTSTYIYKDVDGAKYDILTCGPVWDFESGAGVLYWDDTLFGATFSYTERQQYVWYEQFWKKAEFVQYAAGMNDEMKKVADILVGKAEGNYIFNIDDMLDMIAPSQNMNTVRWVFPTSYKEAKEVMKYGVEVRYGNWFDKIWNHDEYLLGASVTSEKTADGYKLTANVTGKAQSYQWYKLEDGAEDGTPIEGATDSTYTAPDDGTYYCAVTGKNNAYWPYASGKVFKKENIEMFTCPVKAGDGKMPESWVEPYVLGPEPEKPAGLHVDREYIGTVPTSAEPEITEEPINIETNTPVTVTKEDYPYIITSGAVLVLSLAAALIFGRKKKGEVTNG